MSKMDNLRAMREARYEQAQARATTSTARPAATSAPPREAAAKPQARAQAEPVNATAPKNVTPEPEAALCGHRAISGRTCTREAGHAAKSHRYA